MYSWYLTTMPLKMCWLGHCQRFLATLFPVCFTKSVKAAAVLCEVAARRCEQQLWVLLLFTFSEEKQLTSYHLPQQNYYRIYCVCAWVYTAVCVCLYMFVYVHVHVNVEARGSTNAIHQEQRDRVFPGLELADLSGPSAQQAGNIHLSLPQQH